MIFEFKIPIDFDFLLTLIKNATFIVFNENDCDCHIIISFFLTFCLIFFFSID